MSVMMLASSAGSAGCNAVGEAIPPSPCCLKVGVKKASGFLNDCRHIVRLGMEMMRAWASAWPSSGVRLPM